MGRYIAKEGWEPYLKILHQDLDCFTEKTDQNMIRRLAKALYEHEEVATFGSVYSQTAAVDFMYRMAEEGKYIRTYTYDLEQEEYMRNMDEDTLVIIFVQFRAVPVRRRNEEDRVFQKLPETDERRDCAYHLQ